jgi:hypothetical protein
MNWSCTPGQGIADVGLYLGAHRAEHVERSLVIAGDVEPPLDAQALHGISEAEAVHAHADGADQASPNISPGG